MTPAEHVVQSSILRERVDKHVVVVTMNRPRRRNAFDGAMAHELEAALHDFDANPELRVAVLTGTDGVFSAGQDLLAAGNGDFGRTARRGGFGIMRVPPEKPVVAAVEGHALAGGLELCLSCDLIVAARDAMMGLRGASRFDCRRRCAVSVTPANPAPRGGGTHPDRPGRVGRGTGNVGAL
jgi:enoyl-CoA hydratase